MACDLPTIVNRKEQTVERIAKEHHIDLGYSRYSRLKARALATMLNKEIGFTGVYPEAYSDGSYSIFKHYDGIQHAANIEYAAMIALEKTIYEERHDTLEKGETPNKDAISGMAQLLNDKERKNRNIKLEKFILQILGKLNIPVKNFEEFKLKYKKTYNKEIDMIALADMFENIIYISKNRQDGTTLSEEAFHFIVEIFWNDPLISDIRNLSTDGVTPDFKKTDIWANEFKEYYDLYAGDLEKVEKEIIGKLLARTIYDIFQKETKRYKILSVLEKLFGKLLRKIFRNIRLVKEIDPVGISNELDAILGDSVNRMRNESFLSRLSPRSKTVGIPNVPQSSFSEQAVRELLLQLRAKRTHLEQQKLGLYDEMLKKHYEDLMLKISPRSLGDLIAQINALKVKTTLTPIERTQLDDFRELLKLIKLDSFDRATLDKLKKLDKQIIGITRLISAKNFEAGIFMFFFGQDGTGANAAVEDLNHLLTAVKKIKGEIAMGSEYVMFDLEMFGKSAQAISIYSPIIKEFYNLFQSGFTFTELSGDANKELREVVEIFHKTHIPEIEQFLVDNAQSQIREIFEDNLETNAALIYRMSDDVIRLHNTGAVFYNFGAPQDSKEDLLGIFTKMLANVQNKIHSITVEKGKTLYKSLYKLKINYGKLREKNEHGKPGYYYLNEYSVSAFEAAKEHFRETLLERLQTVSAKKGFNLRIPPNRAARHAFLTQYLTIPQNKQTPLQKHVNHLYRLYNNGWAWWFSQNTMEHPRLLQIIEHRKKTLNKTQFERWIARNVKHTEYYSLDGQLINKTYYVGELSVPTDGRTIDIDGVPVTTTDYRNPEYEKLAKSDPDTFAALEILREQHLEDLQKLPIPLTYEIIHRIPQVSKTITEVVYRGMRDIRAIGDNITDIFYDKIDDPLYADRENLVGTNEILDRPKIKFVQKLEHPEVLSEDLIRSSVLFTEMATNYEELMKIIPALSGLTETIKRMPRHATTGITKIFKTFTKTDTEDYLYKKFIHMINTHVKGERFVSSESKAYERLTKLLLTLKNYITRKNLMGNLPSAATGLVSAELDMIIETTIGRNINKKSLMFAIKELTAQSAAILQDFNIPIKTSKVAALAQNIGLIDDIDYTFSNLNVNSVLRAAGKVIDYGEWRTADVFLKYKIMIAIADDIRLSSDGKYYTSAMWKDYVRENPGTPIENYNSFKSIYSGINLVDNSIIYDSYISKEAIEFFKNKVKTTASIVDTQPLTLDKGAAYNHRLLQFLTIHMGWLYQYIGRSFKSEHFNYMREQNEVGIWATFAEKQLYNPVNIFKIIEIYNESSVPEKEALQKLMLITSLVSLTFALVYVLQAIALGRDDDEEDVLFMYTVYVMTRTLMEKEALISISDVLRYASNPISGINSIDDFFGLISLPYRLIFDESDVIEEGFYEGYTKTTQAAIKSVPWVKGAFETMYGGYINEMTGKGATSVAKSIADRNEYIKNKIVNSGDWYTFSQLPFGSVAKASGKALATFPAEWYSDFPKSAGLTKLPTKKDNE